MLKKIVIYGLVVSSGQGLFEEKRYWMVGGSDGVGSDAIKGSQWGQPG